MATRKFTSATDKAALIALLALYKGDQTTVYFHGTTEGSEQFAILVDSLRAEDGSGDSWIVGGSLYLASHQSLEIFASSNGRVLMHYSTKSCSGTLQPEPRS